MACANKNSEKRGLDYYGVLSLTKGASDVEIKKAYEKYAIKYNPLRHKCPDPKMSTLFALVGEAYEVLSNNLLRCIYDQYGEAGLKKGVLTVLGWNPPWQYHGDPNQTFRNFFGTSNPYADIIYCMHELVDVTKNSKLNIVKEKQPPIERELGLTLEEVYFGTTKKMKIQRCVYDKDQITTSSEEKVLTIRIRAGLPAGTKIIYRNIGDEGPNIIPGDLIVTTKDIPHSRFRREGVDLHKDVELELHRSMGDLTIELTTLDCRIIRTAITDLVIPGYKKIIEGEGMPYVNDNMRKGDLILTFKVDFPTYLTDSARKKIIEAIIGSGSPEAEQNSPEVENMMHLARKVKRTKDQKPVEVEKVTEAKKCEDFIDMNREYVYKL